MAQFLLGINYWPQRSAMAMWRRFDLGEVREDFARIKALGLTVVRFFISWNDFQPQPEVADTQMLARLDAVMNALADFHLLAMPSLFTGHMSGVNWLPEWTLDRTRRSGRFRTYCGDRELDWGAGDIYTGDILAASRFFARTVGARYRNHPALFLWDLGNEFSNLRIPASVRDANEWCKQLTDDFVATSDAGVTAGNHSEDLTQDRNFRFKEFCEPLACAVMHGYPVYSAFARGPADSSVVPFLAQLTQSFAAKPVLFTEFGNPQCPRKQKAAAYACLDENEMARYAREVLERLHASGALGAFWWCWADYAKSLREYPPFDRAPHELHFGLIRSDGAEKPVAQVLREFARENRSAIPPPSSIVREEDWFASLPDGVSATYGGYVAHYG